MRIKTAQAVIEVMKENQSNTVFGIPGGQVLFVTDAMYDAGIRFVATRHEGGAGHAADGWGRLTRRPGICLATTGPGATNLITALGGAYRDSSPVIAMVFQNTLAETGRGAAQEADHEALFSSLVKAVIPVRHPDAVVWAVREAYRIALSGKPGPVVLDFYRDVIETGECEYAYAAPQSYVFTPMSIPTQQKIDEAASCLSGFDKIAIWSGNGVKNAQAGSKVLRLAEKLHAPVVTTYNGIGGVTTEHPLVYGTRSRHGSEIAKQILEGADCVVVLGSSMSCVSTSKWKLRLKNIVQIDFDSRMIGKQYPVTCGLTGEICSTLDVLIEVVSVSSTAGEARRAWIKELDAANRKWAEKISTGSIGNVDATPAAPVAVVNTLSGLLKEDTILSVDAGNPGAWSQLLAMKAGMHYMKPVNFGNMAFSLPAAIAACLAEPDRDVVCILGDGSLGMSLGELETASRVGANMTIVLFNDGAFGNIKQEEFFKLGERYIGVNLSDTDYVKVAQGLGCGGETVVRASELPTAFGRSRAHKGPYLLDVKFDGSYTVWPEAF